MGIKIHQWDTQKRQFVKVTESEKEKKKNAVNGGHFVLPAIAKFSEPTPLRTIIIYHFKFRE